MTNQRKSRKMKTNKKLVTVGLSMGAALLIFWGIGVFIFLFASALPAFRSSDLLAPNVVLVNVAIMLVGTGLLIYLRKKSYLSSGKLLAIIAGMITFIIVASCVTIPIYRNERVNLVAPAMVEYMNNKYHEEFVLDEAWYETSGSPGSNNYVSVSVHSLRDPNLKVRVSGNPDGSYDGVFKDSLARQLAPLTEREKMASVDEEIKAVAHRVANTGLVGGEGEQNTSYRDIRLTLQVDNEVFFGENDWKHYLNSSQGPRAILSILNPADVKLYQDDLLRIVATLRAKRWTEYGLDYRLGRPYSYVSTCKFSTTDLTTDQTVKKRFNECMRDIPHIDSYLRENAISL